MLVIADGLPRGAGYLQLDDRPAGGQNREFETYTCTHCSAVVVLNPARTRERYKCRGCNHHICDPCAAKRAAGAACKTVLQQYDEEMAKAVRPAVSTSILLQP